MLTVIHSNASALNARLPDFLVVDLSDACEELGDEDLAENLQALSPRFMRWGNDFWILDLSVCSSYWRVRAKAARCDVLELVRSLLKEMFGDIVRSALADHPWPALLLAGQMRARRLTGLITCKSPFGEALLREISWDLFWKVADQLADHWERIGTKRFQPVAYRRQREQMKRAVQRLGMHTPWQMNGISSDAMRKRFGAAIRDIWDWTFPANGGAQKDDAAGNMKSLFAANLDQDRMFSTGFPWQGYVLESLPCVVRHLEVPVCEWSHIEALLREDLDRLCALSSWLAGERVVSLEWRLIIRDMTHHIVPILFRHPHSLHPEKGCHKTALLQALYSFDNNMPRQDQGYEELFNGYEVPVMPVCGWELVIKERLTIPPQSASLFGEFATVDWNSERGTEDFAMMRLENCLPISLSSYGIFADWTPEGSFIERRFLRSAQDDNYQERSRGSLLAVAKARPLYMYRQPEIFDHNGQSSQRDFRERTMDKWWSQERADATFQRDYYRLIDREQNRLWVFRDDKGHWFKHGIYG